jgi:hypothetical protein
MSYDFRLFLPQPDVDPLVTAEVEPDDESEDINPGPPVTVKEARKQAIAAALTKTNPALKAFEFGFNEIAKSEGITVEKAKERFRHIELNGPEDGNGIQITLFDDTASLTVPYWHKGKNAKLVFAEIWKYLTVIRTVAGYQVYDPQLEVIIDLASDLERAAECYTDVVKRLG